MSISDRMLGEDLMKMERLDVVLAEGSLLNAASTVVNSQNRIQQTITYRERLKVWDNICRHRLSTSGTIHTEV
jgi:hypothetical protein